MSKIDRTGEKRKNNIKKKKNKKKYRKKRDIDVNKPEYDWIAKVTT